ncbi:MAG: ABC transporter ATP-binding protein, partial [Candidatus Bathyarchaeia archaeon]
SIVEEIVNMLKLEERINDYPSELSGGARQKTAIGRAFASGSNLLLLDEPLGALDAKVREVLRLELRDLVKDLGLTAIHVTHDQEEAMAISDRIIIMRAGEIVEVESPKELYLNPKKIFTAYFLGETNFFVGEVVERSNSVVTIKVGKNVMKVKSDVDPGVEKVVAAIRPEFLSMVKRLGEKGRRQAWRCKINDLTFMGSIIRYEVETVDHTPVIIKRSSAHDEEVFRVGDEVYVTFSSRDVNLYPYPEGGLGRETSLE